MVEGSIENGSRLISPLLTEPTDMPETFDPNQPRSEFEFADTSPQQLAAAKIFEDRAETVATETMIKAATGDPEAQALVEKFRLAKKLEQEEKAKRRRKPIS